MSLLKELTLKEEAAKGSTGSDRVARKKVAETTGATSAGAVAVHAGSLFGGGAVNSEKINKQRVRMMRRAMMMPEQHIKVTRISNKWTNILLGEDAKQDFDSADVISKLDAAAERSKVEADTVPFGLEDEDGRIVKVYVAAEQADEFEQALASMLAGMDEDDNDKNTAPEIAEVLFELKDKFTIADVDWGVITGDEEQEQQVGAEGGEQPPPEAGAEGEGGEAGGEDMDLGAEGEGGEGGDEEDMTADTTGADGALQSVIDMMKADAEAKKAEADARKAEANAKEAEYAAKAAAHKVRQEEQVMDMEAAEEQEKKAKDEAETLAKLARFQHKKVQDAETSLSFESVERARMIAQVSDNDPFRSTDGETEEDQELSAEELAGLIMRHLRHNG